MTLQTSPSGPERFDRPGHRIGIGGRLGFAFLLSALLAVIACIIGWLSYERLSLSIRQIGEDDLPATISAGRLAQLGGAIIASAPALTQAETADDVERTSHRIAQSLADMRIILDAAAFGDLRRVQQIVEPFSETLSAIRTATLAALAMRRQNEGLLRELRALHSDFVDEAEPLVDDARFIVQSLLEDIEKRQSEPGAASEIARQMRKADAILQISLHSNLAIGLISRISTVASVEHLDTDMHFLAETIDQIRGQLPAITDASDTITLRQILLRLFEIADPQAGLPSVRRQELQQRKLTDDLLGRNRSQIADLDRELAGILASASRRASLSGEAAAASIQLGRNLQLVIAVIAVLASLIVGFVYVRSNLIRRIHSLADAARALAEGRRTDAIAIHGSDELTDVARAMERFRQAQDGLVQSAKLAALGNLSAGIAHEINQPLNAIRTHAHNAIILQERGDSAGLTRSLRKIESLITRTAQVISHLRRFARRPDTTVTAVSVADATEGAVMLLGGRIKETRTVIIRDIPPGLQVFAEEIRLEQVLVNLLANALDAMAGSAHGEVRIVGQREDGVVRISVIDTGPGISAEVAESLFDPFVTSKPVGAGMGLGLTISYNIIRDFGGSLQALSGTSGGHFVLTLKDATDGGQP